MRGCVGELRDDLTHTRDLVARSLGGFSPREIGDLLAELDVIDRQLESRRPQVTVHDVHNRLLKHAVYRTRRTKAQSADGPRQMTFHRGAIRHLEAELRVLDGLMETEWFANATGAKVPRATDYLNLHEAEQALRVAAGPAARVYDEKFGILEAPGLFLPDLAYYRARCDLREAALAVAFLDIDDFKSFNTKYTETRVDTDVLPRFMAAIEAHVFAHGHAYRFGGDEYVVLLPNVERAAAKESLRALQERLGAIHYPGVDEHTTVSMGLCHLAPRCFLTDREVQARANEAKNHAKRSGKNCIVSYRGELYRSGDLFVS